jgi:RHS repeat-associated protein
VTSDPATVEYDYVDGATDGVAAYLRLGDVIYPNGRQIDYNYAGVVDSVMSQLSSISEHEGGQTDAAFTYLGLDTVVTEDYPEAGVELNYDTGGTNVYAGFDRFGRVVDQLLAADSGTSEFNPQENCAYTYDADGNVLTETNANDSALNDTYVYDAANRLTQWTQGSTTKTYAYDSVGNNIDTSSTGGTYNLDNEETPNVGTSGYDLAGNMTTLSNGDTAVYDAWGRLVEVYQPGIAGSAQFFRYDGTGRRVSSYEQAADPPATFCNWQAYYYAGQQVIESGGATPLPAGYTHSPVSYQYVWSPIYVNAPICRDTLNADGSVTTGDRIFYLTDANNNVTAVVSGSGDAWQVAERYTYDPYGNVTVRDAGTWHPIDGTGSASDTTVGNTLFFAGESYDSSTGLYFDNARYYDPQLGRFISQDPMDYAGGVNLYEYANDSPLMASPAPPPGGQDGNKGKTGLSSCSIWCECSFVSKQGMTRDECPGPVWYEGNLGSNQNADTVCRATCQKAALFNEQGSWTGPARTPG